MRSLLLALLACLVVAAPAAARTGAVDRAATALLSDPVYVDPAAKSVLSDGEADAVRAQISSSDAGPVYVAALPESALAEAGGSINGLLRAVAQGTGRRGTYVVTGGRRLDAGSNVLRVSDLAAAAVTEHRGEGLPAVLEAFIADVAARRTGASTGGGGAESGGSGAGALIPLGGLALLGGGFVLARNRRRRREEAARLEDVKDQVRDELVELGEGIGALDLDTSLTADSAAKEDYGRAVAAYDRANQAWTGARTVDDLAPVGSALEEGRWALLSTRARLNGEAPPERRAPCFFDPRHGPSSRDVEWAPAGGAPRAVPACEADAQRVEAGQDPDFREVAVGGGMVPYWNAGPAYSPFYAGGMFGGFGFGSGLLGGLMLGSMLDPGPAWGGDFGGGYGDGGGGFGGDWGGGGGDFGGGGGGDWGGGGGDFGGGGGDFGGGGGDF